MSDILQRLDLVLTERRAGSAEESYVAGLHGKGLNEILKKVGEEATEVILAAKDCTDERKRQALVAETADLWFHCMVMLCHLDTDSGAVLQELERRFGLSGLDEKASR